MLLWCWSCDHHMIRYTWHGRYHIVLRAARLIGSMINTVTELVIIQCVIMMVKIVKVMVPPITVTMGTQRYTSADKTSYGSSYSQWHGQQSARSYGSTQCSAGCIPSWLGDRYCDHVRCTVPWIMWSWIMWSYNAGVSCTGMRLWYRRLWYWWLYSVIWSDAITWSSLYCPLRLAMLLMYHVIHWATPLQGSKLCTLTCLEYLQTIQ